MTGPPAVMPGASTTERPAGDVPAGGLLLGDLVGPVYALLLFDRSGCPVEAVGPFGSPDAAVAWGDRCGLLGGVPVLFTAVNVMAAVTL